MVVTTRLGDKGQETAGLNMVIEAQWYDNNGTEDRRFLEA